MSGLRKRHIVTVKVAAEILGVSPATIRNWDKAGKLRAKRNTSNSYRYYDIGELERFAERAGLKNKVRNRIKLTLS